MNNEVLKQISDNMTREEAILKLIEFAKSTYDSYGEELEANLYERAIGDEYETEMGRYEEGAKELYKIIGVIVKE